MNVGVTNNDGKGDTMYAASVKINANFSYLFALPGYPPNGLQQFINVSSGPFNGVIGLGDPGVLEWLKINQNFALFTFLLPVPPPPGSWTADSSTPTIDSGGTTIDI